MGALTSAVNGFRAKGRKKLNKQTNYCKLQERRMSFQNIDLSGGLQALYTIFTKKTFLGLIFLFRCFFFACSLCSLIFLPIYARYTGSIYRRMYIMTLLERTYCISPTSLLTATHTVSFDASKSVGYKKREPFFSFRIPHRPPKNNGHFCLTNVVRNSRLASQCLLWISTLSPRLYYNFNSLW